jgi:hypothetical protein
MANNGVVAAEMRSDCVDGYHSSAARKGAMLEKSVKL